MKVKILTAILAACIAICVVFAAGCGGNDKLKKQVEELQQQVEQLTEEKGELSSQAEDLQQQLADLKEQNALTEEQFSELQNKIRNFMNIDWLNECGYTFDELFVKIKPEYSDKEYKADDFLPVKVKSIIKSSSLYNAYNGYDLTLEECNYQYFFYSIITLYNFDFVLSVDLNFIDTGAV